MINMCKISFKICKLSSEKKADFKKSLEYLQKLNDLNAKLGGKSIVTPTLISESLCKELFGLEDRQKGCRDHDALYEGKKVEIKATSSKKGTTTINKNLNYDYLFWLFFDYENNEIEVKITNSKKDEIGNFDSDEDEEEISLPVKDFKKRKCVQLSKIKEWNQTFRIKMSNLTEIK